MASKEKFSQGFTLIELSIVLVIVGFLVGGVLAGQDLIRAAQVRAQITQIEKYNTAVNAFRTQYFALPGDIKDPIANQLGFAARGSARGQGDGNGVIEGGIFPGCSPCSWGAEQGEGETTMFWADLSKAGLIEGAFTLASSTTLPGITVTLTSSPNVSAYLPRAKLENSYLYVYSDSNSVNWYGLSATIEILPASFMGIMFSYPLLSVQNAYSIDAKIDDALATTGSVQASYIAFIPILSPSAVAGSYSSTTCYDSATNLYVVNYLGGQNKACGLSFRFQ